MLRDAESNGTLREVNGLRFADPFNAIAASLAGGLGERGQAALALALSFWTWRTLRDTGMAPGAARPR